MLISLTFDGLEMKDQPTGLEEFYEDIERDYTVYGLLMKYPTGLSFHGDCYNYLLQKKRENGFCDYVDIDMSIRADDGTASNLKGRIFLTDVTFDHWKKIAECQIEDRSFGSLIYQNRKVKVGIGYYQTLGGVVAPIIAEQKAITMHNAFTGIALATTAKTYYLADVMKYIVEYLTDYEMTYQDNYFEAEDTGNGIYYGVTYGNNMRNRSSVLDLYVSFEECMDFLHKKFNLWFRIDYSQDKPVFILDTEDNLFGDQQFSVQNVREMTEEFNQDNFFTSVKIGCQAAEPNRSTTYPLPYVPLIGMSEEVYGASTGCMLDNELDLFTEWCCCTNTIHKVAVSGSTDYDDQVFVLEYTYADSSRETTEGSYGPSGTYLYNETLINENVLRRFTFPTDFVFRGGNSVLSGFDYFQAFTDVDYPITPAVFPFYDDFSRGFDTGGNYDNSTYQFDCPASKAGLYRFRVTMLYRTLSLIEPPYGSPDNFATVTVRIRKYNSVGTLLETKTTEFVVVGVQDDDDQNLSAYASFYLDVADYVNVNITVSFLYVAGTGSNSFVFKAGSWFQNTYVFNGGGTVIEGDVRGYRSSVLTFERNISKKDWAAIKNNTGGGFLIDNGNRNALCHIQKISRNLKTGKTDWEMITSLKYNNL